ncbi:hypothetical protein B0T22DRAFT_76612 [Podospora appendiculata]|uniref:Secreted protein n=1 Tax=Podospora appendiculata TaxID=314037 RepID=A0AAE1CHL0_9PEZI|nr:hypothetical protein B0T22DRAFT_76612 [Podospora appendiculata]
MEDLLAFEVLALAMVLLVLLVHSQALRQALRAPLRHRLRTCQFGLFYRSSGPHQLSFVGRQVGVQRPPGTAISGARHSGDPGCFSMLNAQPIASWQSFKRLPVTVRHASNR